MTQFEREEYREDHLIFDHWDIQSRYFVSSTKAYDIIKAVKHHTEKVLHLKTFPYRGRVFRAEVEAWEEQYKIGRPSDKKEETV